MKELIIKVLDCTLRDGGYINNWSFGRKTIPAIAEKLGESAIDYIECGFLSSTKESGEEQSIFGDIARAETVFSGCPSKNLALMINCGEYSADDIPEYSGGKISILRIAFHKNQTAQAKELCRRCKDKGYRIFVQPMVTLSYSDSELLGLIEWANAFQPEAFYMVDSFGTMRKRDVLRMFFLIDNNLSSGIRVGFHSHNNLQLSFSNAQELISANSCRGIIIDSTVLGMGRGAGNLCTELITRHINENIEDKYDILPILEIMDEHIMPIYNCRPWGYSAAYYIAAINGCHPNYASRLTDHQTLCIRDINAVIRSIPDDKKQTFDSGLAEKLYFDYQAHTIDDKAAVAEIAELCSGRDVLILAPGKSLLTCREAVRGYIDEHCPVVFGINHIPELYEFDRVFISNLKRFKSADEAVKRVGSRIICTSNISVSGDVTAVNYSDYLCEDSHISDNAGLMLINLLRKAGVRSVALAGYDGFGYSGAQNYYDERLVNSVGYEEQQRLNEAITKYIAKLRKVMDIRFITPSIYENAK